jgi:hypothetical protein
MQSKSHFLIHFIPGILLGSVVGLAFGSLLVASQIPRQVTGVNSEEEAVTPVPTVATPVRPTPHEQNLVTVLNAKTDFSLNYSTDADLFEKPVMSEVACGAYLPPDGYDAWPVEPSTVTVKDHAYQLYVVEGGAAGTTYITPYYFTNVNGTCVEAHWTYAQVNCLNYNQGADRYACIDKNSQIATDSDFIVSQFNYISD